MNEKDLEIRYDIEEYTVAYTRDERNVIKKGCAVMDFEIDKDMLESFSDLNEAVAALENYRTVVKEPCKDSKLYFVTEYAVRENTYFDGEVYTYGDVLKISSLDIDVLDKNTSEVVATCHSLSEAEEVVKSYKYPKRHSIVLGFWNRGYRVC